MEKNKKEAKTICFLHRKGGVGKTASALAFSAACASKGLRVLMVDLDSQCTLTQNLLKKGPSKTVVSSFTDGTLPIVEIQENLDLLPGSSNIVTVEAAMDNPDDRLILNAALNKCKGRYDIIVLDCPPSLGYVTVNALTAADRLFVPMQAAKESFDTLKDVVVACYQAATPTRIDGIFFTFYSPNEKVTQRFEAKTRASYGEAVLHSTIRKCNKIKESAENYSDVLTFAPNSNAAKDYLALTDEILGIVLPDNPKTE